VFASATPSLIRPFAVIETDDGPMAAANASGGGLGRWDPVTGVAAGGAFGLDAGSAARSWAPRSPVAGGLSWMVLGEDDGSILISPLPGAEE
jgi:hypothetical protein